jgi:acyl carrier protein
MTDKIIIEAIKNIAKKRNMQITDKDFDKQLKHIGIDSLTAISLIIDIEEELKIRIPDEKLDSIKTLNDLINIAKII